MGRTIAGTLLTALVMLACGGPDASSPTPGVTQPSREEVVDRAGAEALRLLGISGWTASEEADVVLLAARATARLLEADVASDENLLHEQLRRLRDLAMLTPDGSIGWGLSFPFDAFSDGSVNPARTIYSYTTAHAGLAFMDGFDVTGRGEYLDVARRALDTLLDETCCWREDGQLSVWYSDQSADQAPPYRVHNVNGLSLALLSRMDDLDPAFSRIRLGMIESLVREQGRGLEGDPATGADDPATTNWTYDGRSGLPNDLIHESFIVSGLLASDDPDGVDAAEASLRGIWDVHFAPRGCPHDVVHTQGTHGWGPPAGLFVLSGAEAFRDEALAVARCLLREGPSTRELRELAPEEHGRAVAWYALGYAEFVRSSIVSPRGESVPSRSPPSLRSDR